MTTIVVGDYDDDPFVDGDEESVIAEVLVEEEEPEIAVLVEGPQGPEGKVGPQGLPGSSSASYIHIQRNPAAVWTIQHKLGYKPSITVLDSEGNLLLGWKIDWQSDSVLLLRFSMLQSGIANAS